MWLDEQHKNAAEIKLANEWQAIQTASQTTHLNAFGEDLTDCTNTIPSKCNPIAFE